MPKMSQEILSHMTEGGMPAKVTIDVDGEGAFTMEFEDG